VSASPHRVGRAVDPQALARRLALAFLATGTVYGLSLAFFPLWLSARGLDAPTIGLITALPTAALIFVNPWICAYADRHDRIAASYVASAALIPLGFLAMALAPDTGWLIVAGAALAVARAPLQPLGDALAFALVARDKRVDYGRVRLWLSVSVLATMAVGGFVVERVAPAAMIWVFVAITGAGAAVAVAIAPSDRDVEAPTGLFAAKPALARPSRALVGVIAAAALVQGSHGALYAFGSLGWRAQGASDGFIGLIWAAGVAAEVALFAASQRVRVADRPATFMIAGALGATLRWTVSAVWAPAGWGALALQTTHMISYGATHLGALYLLARLAPKDARAQAQGWINAAIAGATMLATLASGPLWKMDPSIAYGAMAAIAAAGLGLALASARGPQRPQMRPDALSAE
jgi:PPP family 3-phenylpropionic acid transporter